MGKARKNGSLLRSFPVKEHLILGLIAILTMLFATLSSPLYPLNNWVDANAFFTMGKAMFNGKVLYRDVFDHKGPILHFLHGVAWLISNRSFFGVWILEIIACYFTLLFSYRILELYTDKRAILMMPVFAVLLYTTSAMAKGDSAEEFCLPLLMYAVLIAIRSLKEKKEISKKSLLLVGITSGVIAWIKYTMLGFYLGWIILPLILALKAKNWKYILNMVLYIGAGVVIATLPVLAYFLLNGALSDLWEVYFYINIFKYDPNPEGCSVQVYLLSILHNVLLPNMGVISLMVIGGIWAVVKRKFLLAVQVILMLLGGFLVVYSNIISFPYYMVIFCGFAIFGFIPLYRLLSGAVAKLKGKLYAAILIAVCLLALPASYVLSDNTDMLQYEKEDLPQFQFAQIINQKENATVLNCGFMDGGFYTVSGVVPSTKYFCLMNANIDEAVEEQKEAIRSGAVDFVITKNQKITAKRYEEVMTSTFEYRGQEHEYTLYRKID